MSIYRLYNDNGLSYYGATKLPLHTRLSKHRSDFNMNKGNTTSRLIFNDNEKVEIELVEAVEDLSILNQRERFYIENNQCVNKVIPTRTPKEWRNADIDRIKAMQNEYSKQYYINNRERILNQKKEIYKNKKQL